MLQRFLSILAILATLASIGSVLSLPLNAQAATHYQRNAITPQANARCPDVPERFDPIVDFCSPKLHGYVAGPYGAHIVLATENMKEKAPLWLLVNSEQPITETGKLIDCLNQKRYCSLMNDPEKLNNNEGKITVYTFTWTGSNFPTKPGDYYIEIMSSKEGVNRIPNQFIAATPISYTLLSPQAPCITISINDHALTNCYKNSQNTIQPSTTQSSLNIQGNYWLLGRKDQSTNKKDQNTDYQIHISARCTKPHQCSKEILFDLILNVYNDGSFSSTQALSSPVQGNYTLLATNTLVSGNIDPTQSDYLSTSNNSIANGSLEISPFTFSLQPPQSSSTNLSTYAIAGTIPALLGLLFFCFLLLLTRYRLARTQSRTATALQTHSPSSSNSYPVRPETVQQQSSSQRSSNEPEAISIDFLLKELPFLPFPLRENPQLPFAQASHLPLSQRNIPRTIEKVTSQWQQKGSTTTAEKALTPLLYYDVASSKRLLKQINLPLKTPLTPQRIQALNTHVGKILLAARREKTNRQQLCSQVLVYCVVLLSISADPLYHSTLQYCMGYAYGLLAANNPPTTTALLEEAERNYQAAYNTIVKNTSNELLRNFSVILQAAIGDINTARALVPQTHHNQILNCYGLATTNYQMALNLTTDPLWKDVIQERWQVVDHQRSVSRGKS